MNVVATVGGAAAAILTDNEAYAQAEEVGNG